MAASWSAIWRTKLSVSSTCSASSTISPSMKVITTIGVGNSSHESSRKTGRGAAMPLASRIWSSRYSSRAMLGLAARSREPWSRATSFSVVPSARSISSAVTWAETPPSSGRACRRRLFWSIRWTSWLNAV
jgi:hypothetical protein